MGVGDVVWFLYYNDIVSAMIVHIEQHDYAEYNYTTKEIGAVTTKVSMDLIGTNDMIYKVADVQSKRMFTTKAALVASLSA